MLWISHPSVFARVSAKNKAKLAETVKKDEAKKRREKEAKEASEKGAGANESTKKVKAAPKKTRNTICHNNTHIPSKFWVKAADGCEDWEYCFSCKVWFCDECDISSHNETHHKN